MLRFIIFPVAPELLPVIVCPTLNLETKSASLVVKVVLGKTFLIYVSNSFLTKGQPCSLMLSFIK